MDLASPLLIAIHEICFIGIGIACGCQIVTYLEYEANINKKYYPFKYLANVYLGLFMVCILGVTDGFNREVHWIEHALNFSSMPLFGFLTAKILLNKHGYKFRDFW